MRFFVLLVALWPVGLEAQVLRDKMPLDFSVHGNWCGPKADRGDVMDKLDAMCRRHDLCARREGIFRCSCDLAFMQELRHARWPNEALYNKARAIYEVIALLPCNTSEGQREKMAMVYHDWRGAVARGRESQEARWERFWWLVGIALSDSY